MPVSDTITPNPPKNHIDTFSGLLIRLFWMIGGNIALFFLLVGIFKNSSGTYSWLDLAYWLVVAAQIAARFYDIRCLGGATADYATATLQDWAKHAAILFVTALVLWGAAHLF